MVRHISAKNLAVIIVLAGACGIPAAAQQPDLLPFTVPTYLDRLVRHGMARERFLSTALNPLRKYDVDRDGLDSKDIDEAVIDYEMGIRANQIRKILQYDRNADGSITAEEIETTIRRRFGTKGSGPLTDRARKNIKREVEAAIKDDKNGDRIITYAEMLSARPPSNRRRNTTADSMKAMLALDPNKDGRVTADELTRLAEDAFERYDTNGNGILEKSEIIPIAQNNSRYSRLARFPCNLPKPPSNADVVVLGVYSATSISTVSVAGMDEETHTGKIIVEPGDKPLYVIVSSYDPMIWQFSGETGRIKKAVVVPARAGPVATGGVTGVSKDQVTFVERNTCAASFHDVRSRQAIESRALIEHTIGREINHFHATYDLASVSLPSGQQRKLPPPEASQGTGIPPTLWDEFKRFSPGGVTEIDPSTVIAATRAETYDVLPQQAGLIQLYRDGALKFVKPDIFHIVKPIPRFPAGLAGAHSVKFVLDNNITMPAGSPGHSCVKSGKTGAILEGGRRCKY